jgi:acetyl/propionyl-CoA carboxylase alpha subunit/acetyl-CoA carboxylase carboxyltransferase component
MRRRFERVAIVNRGEAALRFIHAARELQEEAVPPLRSIALFTEPDRSALFVREADEACDLGPAMVLDAAGNPMSAYLDHGVLERALERSRAEAVWPGWGFVAEHAGFADLCARLGLAFIGPSAPVMRALGDKIASKRLAERLDIPVVPWSGAPVETVEEADRAAEALGYPLMVKASAGGGGRGIREVRARADLPAALRAARAEAMKAFGDPTVYLERLLRGVRHVEVQVIADAAGTTWAVGVRDCTIQRRHQKVVEESACPGMSGSVERMLRDAAVRLARAASYENAGTVEFLFDPRREAAWFMEVNARLQVEHPVTEATTGLDLVKLQVHVARGGRLVGEPPPPRGHAIEVRLNAEDADHGFAPAPGVVTALRIPSGPGLRFDTGVQEGDSVPAEFDSMVGKVIAHGRDRGEAVARLARALSQSHVVIGGGATNKGFLMEVLADPAFRSGELDVDWLDRRGGGAEPPARHAEIALMRAAIDAYDADLDLERARFLSSAARGRPEVGPEIGRAVELAHEGAAYRLEVRRTDLSSYQVVVDGHTFEVSVERLGPWPARERRAWGSQWRLHVAGESRRTRGVVHGVTHHVEVDGVPHTFVRERQGIVRSPSPAIVVSVAVRAGDEVAAGDRLLVLEAMKMETSVRAPFAGRVREVLVMDNVQVGAGAPLLALEPSCPDATRPGRLRLAHADAPPADAGNERSRVLGRLRGLVLGFDLEAPEVERLLARWDALCAAEAPPEVILPGELAILDTFVDLSSLFRRQAAGDPSEEDQRRSTEEYLFTYLRDLDRAGAGLPPAFLQRLQRALGHFGVSGLLRSAELEESLFRICRAHPREEEQAAVVFRILERCLERPPAEPGEGVRAPFRHVLDRLIAQTQGRHPSLNDLAREVRYRCFERPLLERARERVYAEAEGHLSCLAGDPEAGERAAAVQALVQCPQPLAGLVSGRFLAAAPPLRQAILEVLLRRYYRIRDLRTVTTTEREGLCLATAEYDHGGRRIQVITAHAEEARLAETLQVLARMAAAIGPDRDLALDFFLWRPAPCAAPDVSAESLRRVLEGATFARPLRRIVCALSGAGAERRPGGTQYFTFRPAAAGYEEERLYRGVHPMMAKRLQMGRLGAFDLDRLPSVEDVYVLHARARDNPRDERLFALAEVRDLTPIRDDRGRVVQLPHLERMLLEALGGIRRFQARRPPGQRLQGNGILLYVWPLFDLSAEDMDALAAKLAPATEDLGLESVALHVRMPEPNGAPAEAVLEVALARQGVVVTRQPPTDAPIPPLGAYEQKVVRLAQRGLAYPYELIRMLAPPAGAAGVFPPGSFIEHDLDGTQLVPVSRPFGRNQANVVVGLLRSYTARHPEGMARVLVLGDPSRELGCLAEPECRRLLAALDLAAREGIPLDWIALSAGARISMESGTENMDWIARVLRRLVDFTQKGGEVNVVVNGINVGAQPYWNAEATMLMHTRGILVMTPDSSMVLTGKRALDYSGGVSAEDNQGIGGYERVMGPNGQAQYFARDLAEACRILQRHHEHTYVAPGERFPRRAPTDDPLDRDVCAFPYTREDGLGLSRVGEALSSDTNPGRKRAFDIRTVMAAVADQDAQPLERWAGWRDAETAVVWEARLGGHAVALIGIESRPLSRLGFVPADGPDQWTAGTLFPQSSRKLARALNAASGRRPAVVLANLVGFDGSPESLRLWQLEYGAEIGRAVVNFDGPIVFCVISRYHGGAFVVFSSALNDNLQVIALEGTQASVIGGAPAAAVVFPREVERRVADDARVRALERRAAEAEGAEKARLRAELDELLALVQSEKMGEVAAEFDAVHSVERALRVGSVHEIIPAARLRPHLVAAVERGMEAARGRPTRREFARADGVAQSLPAELAGTSSPMP